MMGGLHGRDEVDMIGMVFSIDGGAPNRNREARNLISLRFETLGV